ncbi:phage tail protein [Fusobacterium sp. 27098_8_59]|uniref:phage tail protein n=1 Tax=Fusobacterium sp. 27098_8_59 TaxID=3003691 RepID=UPI00352E627A
MAKTIGVLLSLKDQFTTPLQKATKSVKNMDRQLEKAGNQIKAFGNRVKAGMKSVAKWAAIGFGALTAAAGVFIKQSIDAAKDKLKADKLLETNLMKQANASKEHIKTLKDEASALQDIGVVGDDVAVAGASRLAVFKMNADQIKKTMPILDDMIAYDKGLNGTQEDAIAIGELYGKAINGKVNALKKYGVVLTANEEKLFKVMSTEQRIEFINKKLEKSIGGTNKALRETDEGKIVAMKGAWGDMQAELGKKLIPQLGAIAEWFHSKIPSIQDFILSLADKIQELVNKASPYIDKLKEIFGKIFEKVKPALEETWKILSDAGTVAIDIAQDIINNWDRISPVVYTIVGAITAYNIATTIRNNKELIYAGIMKTKMALDTAQAILTGQLTIKQWALNAAMNANPIGIVIGAIALLVGGIWLLCKNWDLVKKKVVEFWQKLDNNPLGKVLKFIIKFGNPIGAMINAFLFLKDVITQNWETIKDFAMTLWDNLVGAFNYVKDVILGVCDVVGGIFTAIWDGVVSALDKLKEGFNKVTDFITGAFMSAWDSLMNALDIILHPIETAKKAFGGLIDKLKFWNSTPVDDKTINITEKTTKTTDSIGGINKTGSSTTSVKNPRHALGTAYFKGGVTGINEGGRDETAILPAGTKIMSHEESKTLEKRSSNKGITVNITVSGNFIGEKEHMEKYGEYTANKILAALNNM